MPEQETLAPQFFDTPEYAVVDFTTDIATADLNRDGNPDVVVSELAGGSYCEISVLLGNGDGTFKVHKDYAAAASAGGPGSVVIADFNKDGKPDVVMTCAGDLDLAIVSILLGNGDGTLQTPMNYQVAGGWAPPLATGDFNNDGRLDLVIANACDNPYGCTYLQVAILLADGDGTFAQPRYYAAGYWEQTSVAVGDFNGDGKADLAVGDGAIQRGLPSTVNVMLGNGDGSFQPFVSYLLAPDEGITGHIGVAIADVNKDGSPDLVVTPYFSTVQVLFGNGDGTFQVPVAYGTWYSSDSPIVADFNSDGELDVGFLTDANVAGVLLGNGDGSFGQELITGTGRSSRSVAAADFNGDGKLDLATGGGVVSVLLGNGDATFQARPEYALPVPERPTVRGSASAVAFGDFTHDGNLDLVATTSCGADPQCVSGTLSILIGNGNSFADAVSSLTGIGASAIGTGDFNKDGNLDVVTANYQVPVDDGTNLLGISVLLGNGDGTFQPHVDYAGGKTFNAEYGDSATVAVGDLNGDGNLDIIASGPGVGAVVWVGDDDGTFRAGVSYSDTGGDSSSVALGDFNADGTPDMAVSNGAQVTEHDRSNEYPVCRGMTVSILLGRGDGTLGPPQAFATAFDPESVVVADVNGDGKPDLVVGSAASDHNCSGTPSVSVLLGNGDGTFQSHKDSSLGSTILEEMFTPALAVGDFNLDGRLDVAAVSSDYDSVSLLAGNGDGTFQAPSSYRTGYGVVAVAAADFNKDGKPDLAAANEARSTVSLLRNIQGPDFSVSMSSVDPINPGGSASSTVTITSILGFSGSVALSCSVSPMPSQAPTCSLNPTPVQLAANGSATSTLTIRTAAAVSRALPVSDQDGRNRYALWLSVTGLAVAIVGMRRMRKPQLLILSACMLLFSLLQFGCGGGGAGSGGNGGGSAGTVPGTPSGTYTITVTASSPKLSHGRVLILKVK